MAEWFLVYESGTDRNRDIYRFKKKETFTATLRKLSRKLHHSITWRIYSCIVWGLFNSGLETCFKLGVDLTNDLRSGCDQIFTAKCLYLYREMALRRGTHILSLSKRFTTLLVMESNKGSICVLFKDIYTRIVFLQAWQKRTIFHDWNFNINTFVYSIGLVATRVLLVAEQ